MRQFVTEGEGGKFGVTYFLNGPQQTVCSCTFRCSCYQWGSQGTRQGEGPQPQSGQINRNCQDAKQRKKQERGLRTGSAPDTAAVPLSESAKLCKLLRQICGQVKVTPQRESALCPAEGLLCLESSDQLRLRTSNRVDATADQQLLENIRNYCSPVWKTRSKQEATGWQIITYVQWRY